MANLNRDDLAQWPQLDAQARQQWLAAAVKDRNVARELKLAMALHEGAEPLVRDWVTQAGRSSSGAHFWRPAFGAAAALGLAAVLFNDRPEPTEAPMLAMQASDSRPDQMGAMSFEGESDGDGELFGGSFEHQM